MKNRCLLLSLCLAGLLYAVPAPAHNRSVYEEEGQDPQSVIRSIPSPKYSLTEIICLLLTILSTGTAIVCIYRMRRMENRFRSFRTEPETAVAPKPETDAAESASGQTEDPQGGDPYTPYDSSGTEYDRIFMERLDILLDENIMNQDMDVDFLAEKMMISRSLLFNRVKRISGLSVTKYVNRFRIDRSVEMFASPQLSLTEIAESTGFSTLRYYSRVFKSIKGEVPSVYRERILHSRRPNQ